MANAAMGSTDLMLADLKEKFTARVVSPTYTRLYDDHDFGQMFAALHEQLNQHFESINDRARSTQTALLTISDRGGRSTGGGCGDGQCGDER